MDKNRNSIYNMSIQEIYNLKYPQGPGIIKKRKATAPASSEQAKKAKTDASVEARERTNSAFNYTEVENSVHNPDTVTVPSRSSPLPNISYEASNTNENFAPAQNRSNVSSEGEDSLDGIADEEKSTFDVTSPASLEEASLYQPAVSFTVAIPRRTRLTNEELIARSIPYEQVEESPPTVLWCILDAENATMNVVRKKRVYKGVKSSEDLEPEGPTTCRIAEKTYTLYKWYPTHLYYQIQWLVNGTKVLSAEMKLKPKPKKLGSRIAPNSRQIVSRTVAAQLPANQALPRLSAELLPASSINALFVVSDDHLFHQLTTALQELDFGLQINCDHDQLCLYTRRGRVDDNIVVLKYSEPKHLKVITECNEVVDEVLFLVPSSGVTMSIASFSDNDRRLEVKNSEFNQGVVASVDDLPIYLAQAVRHSLDCCKNVNVGAVALSNSETPEELKYYLASWLARCVPIHQQNVYLCFKFKHTTAMLITEVAQMAMAAIISRVGQVNEKGYAYGCVAVLISCSPLLQMFIAKEGQKISSDLVAQGLTLTSIYQIGVRDVETLLKDEQNRPFAFVLFDLLCELLLNDVPRSDQAHPPIWSYNNANTVQENDKQPHSSNSLSQESSSNVRANIEAYKKNILEVHYQLLREPPPKRRTIPEAFELLLKEQAVANLITVPKDKDLQDLLAKLVRGLQIKVSAGREDGPGAKRNIFMKLCDALRHAGWTRTEDEEYYYFSKCKSGYTTNPFGE